MRFDSVPGTFSLEPLSKTAFTEIFADEYTSPSHQIGVARSKTGWSMSASVTVTS
ncbi:MAG: hypothetical protein R3B51_00735 [Thermodesulfobacteriota bacterium]